MAGLHLPMLSALADKMRWHQTRQTVLAENVANAETPGYRGRDLAPFSTHLKTASTAQVAALATHPGHISVQSRSGGAFGGEMSGFETTPDGNQVTLEDEMIKVASNQMEYQAITTLYTRSVKLLRTALGRSA